MDRIRAYVLRKFASTASLEVLRSPTYVEQVQEVIDRAAPIIKEKLEEIGRPRGKRSRSVDLAWNGESLHRYAREERGHGEGESGRGKSSNGLERKAEKREETRRNSFGRDETNSEEEEEKKKKLRRRSAGSGKRSRRRESGDFGVVDQVDENSKHSSRSEREFGAARDTLEARLTATQSILENISKSTSELGGARKGDPAENDPSESEISDHNVVSLPIVRPPSSRNSRSAARNGSDSLTLPPISPEAPKSTKKKDELSLPVLSANNGNHSARRPQEQDISKDAEEASTMHDITSDMEDIAILPENEDAIVNAKQDSANDRLDLDLANEEKRRDEAANGIFREDSPAKIDEKRGSLEEFEELEELEEARRSGEVFGDSLNVAPEVADVPLRVDSLESDGDKRQDDNANSAKEGTFDRLKDKLIEIEMAERSIEKALACQQIATGDIGEMTSQAEKSVTDGKINEAGKLTNEAEGTLSEIRKSTGAGKIPINKDDEVKSNGDKKGKSTDDIEEIKDVTGMSNETKDLNVGEKSTNKVPKKMEGKAEGSTNGAENSRNKVETSSSKVKKSATENEAEQLKNKAKILKNGVEKAIDQSEIMAKATEDAIQAQDERSMDKTEKSVNEKLLNGEELAVKVHVESLQSVNPKSYSKNSQVTEVAETDGENATTSKKRAENAASGFSKSTTSGSTTVQSEGSNVPHETRTTKARKKRESDKLPVMTPLSLELPYAYVLSEGSPCEIPDSVTTVIIPDRPCPSPVNLEDEDYKLELATQKEESLARSNVSSKGITKDERQEKNQRGMEVFGEYVRPETVVLPIDTDLVRGVKGMKPSQEIVIVHQDLDRIKEEGEEEEEKEESERKEIEEHRRKKNETVKEEEVKKLATLENIVEHEEHEEIVVKTIESKDAEEISPGVLEYKFLSDIKDLTVDTDSTNEGRADVATEVRSAPENSSEESGSPQDTRTTMSSDVKESTISNRSIGSPGGPIVPELNLDSLQDNTVSSFKMSANGTEKENNGSRRESDATTSLVEPLTSDERLNRLALADNGEEILTEELMERGLQSEAPEADQLYHAEHAEYEWLGRDPLSTEINLEDEAKCQEDNIALSKDIAQIEPILRKKEEAEELGSEEEIARELIDSLDKDMQFRVEKLDSKEKLNLKGKLDSKRESGESVKSDLDTDDKSDELLSASVHSMSVEQKKRDHKDSLVKIDDVINIEEVSESNNVTDINRVNKDEKSSIINEEIGQIKLGETKEAHVENSLAAPLAQFEQELFEENNKLETAEKIIIQSEPDIINTDHTDIQEKLEEKQTNAEEVRESQSSGKIEDRNKKLEENKQQELQSQEKREQEKLEVHEGYVQEKLDIKEEIEQEKLKIQGTSNEENVKIEEEIIKVTAVPLEVTKSREDSINESMSNDNRHEETKLNNESILDDRAEKYAENEKEEKTEDLSEKIESVHGPITSAISEQSVEDRSRFGYWTTVTKSSTVETVIEAFDSNTSTDEKMEIVADASEIVADESLRKKNDFHSAVVKIQACE